ncbi:BgTH12-03680 [Blumeria graminis f. sp. triticale]|uniref:BgTH12-03680 n=1 Tax=Blumeria graminis f. sp. triticale TaxID=1689686 RepID=A0A9W4GBI7_BLUGR|nr:BgTH12-03680 [Blumeria graminis f. sp. triticale]
MSSPNVKLSYRHI